MSFNEFYRRPINTPCPKCQSHIKKDDQVCCHCGYELSPIEFLNADHQRITSRNYGAKLAIVIVPLFLFTISFISWLVS